MFAEMDLVIDSCRDAILSSDLRTMLRQIRCSKNHYAKALRRAAPLAFTKQDVQNMDSKSHHLEELISRLETKCAALMDARKDRR